MPRTCLQSGPFLLDPAARIVLAGGAAAGLTPRLFDLLVAFLQAPGRVLTKEELIAAVWPGQVVEENNLTQHIFQLRKALAAAGGKATFIETIPRTGYQWVATVEAAEPAALPAARPRSRRKPVGRYLAGAAAVLLVTAAGAFGWLQWRLRDVLPPNLTPSVAILPFQVEESAKDWAWLAAGGPLEVASALGRLEGVSVQNLGTPPAASEKPAATARRLHADYVVTGRIAGAESPALEATFYDARKGETVWVRQFPADASAPARAVLNIATEVAATLAQRANAPRRILVTRRFPRSPQAYRSFLEAMQLLETRGAEDLQKARTLLQSAVVIEPDFGSAWGGLAEILSIEAEHQTANPVETLPRALALAAKAIQLDPDVPEALIVRAWAFYSMGAPEQAATAAFEDLRRRFPASPQIETAWGMYLTRIGRFAEAEKVLERAVASDPTSLWPRQQLATNYYYSHEFEKAKLECERMIRLNPRSVVSYGTLVPVLWMQRNYTLAAKIADRVAASGLTQPQIQMGIAYSWARAGRTAEARKILQGLYSLRAETYVAPQYLALVHLGLGEKKEAVQLLAQCARVHCTHPSALWLDPAFDEIRNDPAYPKREARKPVPVHETGELAASH